MVIESTTLDTEDKVKAQYGGETWIQHTGYVLRGASSGVVANSTVKTGGEDSVTLTVNQIPSHRHGIYNAVTIKPGGTTTQYQFYQGQLGNNSLYSEYTGGGQAHNNIPNYKSVYIWERTA